MPSSCFDRFWIIFREEPHQSVLDNAIMKVKTLQYNKMYPDVLKFLVETEIFFVELQSPPFPNSLLVCNVQLYEIPVI